MPAIEARQLTKTFTRSRRRGLSLERAAVTAVDNLSFTIDEGEFVGFLGPNGAGKSTTIKMLTGILHPSAGTVLVTGVSPQRQRIEVAQRIGVVFGQRTGLWWDLPLQESFEILRALYRIPSKLFQRRLDELEAVFRLSAFWRTPVRQLSLGQRMRGELTGSLLHDPAVLFLDEPTIGLDVTAKSALRAFLQARNRERGTTVILTTHDMSDVEELCTRILVIDRGLAVFDGSASELALRVGLPSRLTARYRHRGERALLLDAGWIADDQGDAVTVSFDRQRTSPVAVLSALQDIGVLEDFAMAEPGLEDVIDKLYHGRLGADR